ncbi:MAG: type II secretion system protein [Planctomycetota bacterium]
MKKKGFTLIELLVVIAIIANRDAAGDPDAGLEQGQKDRTTCGLRHQPEGPWHGPGCLCQRL